MFEKEIKPAVDDMKNFEENLKKKDAKIAEL